VALRSLDRDGAVAKVFICEDSADGDAVACNFVEATEYACNVLDVLSTKLLPFTPKALAHLFPEAAGVDQLHLALARSGFAVGDNPDKGADARVVEHIGRQADDRFEQIVLQHITANLAFARPCPTCEEGGTIENDAEPAAAILRRPHLRQQME